MKKKVNILGKSVPVFVLVLLGIGLVSAALITSWGTITGSVIAKSPIEQYIAEGLKDGSEITNKNPISFNLLGGGEVLLSIKTKNLASKKIEGVAENLVTGIDGTGALPLENACGELSKLWLKTESSITEKSWPGIYDKGTCETSPYDFVWEVTGENEGICWHDALAGVIPLCSSDTPTMTISWGNPEGTTWDALQVDVTQIKAEFYVNAIGTYDFTSQIIPA